MLLHLLATLVLELLHQFPQAWHLLSIAVWESSTHHVPQRLHDVSVVEDVIGEEVHQLVGVKFEDPLGAVPLRVPVCAVEHRAFFKVRPVHNLILGS
ncbi:uncharacterized protein METZ01_LOCUS144946 [marine metagenome]|uniref:Uncharacterized protein n=1 Tax=marine metagenome TaxID=408172 RepID=A0A381ZT87_9ZZZZ